MKKVYVADKASYGSGFTEEFNTLQELKEAIVKHETMVCDYNDDGVYVCKCSEYSEETFKECKNKGQYTLFEVELDESEYIWFDDYDGSSRFEIRKQEVEILSKFKEI